MKKKTQEVKQKIKVLIIIPTKESVDPRTLEAVYAQDYKNFSVLINPQTPDPLRTRVQNIISNRIECQEKALKTDADYFLWLDSDVILPKDALSNFILLGKPLMGASYQIGRGWSTGKKNTFMKIPVKEITAVDHIGFGAMMISREVMEKVLVRDCSGEKSEMLEGHSVEKCECFAFCEDAQKLGYIPYVVPIVCTHNKKLGFFKVPVEIGQQMVKMLQESDRQAKEVTQIMAIFSKLQVIE